MNYKDNRRNFIRNTSIGTLAALTIPQIVSSALAAAPKGKKVSIEKGDTILFQGASLTDSARRKTNNAAPNDAANLGNGYALMTTGHLLLEHPDKELKFFTRGVSGNKVFEMAARWDAE